MTGSQRIFAVDRRVLVKLSADSRRALRGLMQAELDFLIAGERIGMVRRTRLRRVWLRFRVWGLRNV